MTIVNSTHVSIVESPPLTATVGKTCTKCNVDFELTEFHRDKNRKDGRRPWCKTCVRAYQQANKEQMVARAREWRQANPESHRQSVRKWREENLEYYREYNRAWSQAKLQDEPEEFRRQRREAWHRWVKKNPDKARHYGTTRRAREIGAKGKHTLEQWLALCESHGHKCLHCGTSENLTRDHIIPLSKGGSDYIENIQPLCHSCNARKGART